MKKIKCPHFNGSYLGGRPILIPATIQKKTNRWGCSLSTKSHTGLGTNIVELQIIKMWLQRLVIPILRGTCKRIKFKNNTL